jgi:hypothetical protein
MMQEAFSVEWEYDDDEQGIVYVQATGIITRSYPGRYYGDPPEGDEVDFDSICCFDENNKPVDFDDAYKEDLIDYVLSLY